MDHYKILGVTKSASKDEIKKAFRKLAMQFHPDKHSQSSKNLKDAATLKFKLLSEAYDTLIDDQKRADYNIKSTTTSSSTYHQQRYSSRYYNSNNNGGSSSSYYGNYGYGYGGSSSSARSGGGSQSVYTRFEMGVKYLTTRAFLLNATFVGVLIGGTYIVDAGGRALWQMHNPGKSFEEAMESVEKAKAYKDDSR